MSADGQNDAKNDNSSTISVKLFPYIIEKLHNYDRNNRFVYKAGVSGNHLTCSKNTKC